MVDVFSSIVWPWGSKSTKTEGQNLCWFLGWLILYQLLTQAGAILEEGTLIGKILLPDWLLGKHGLFLD